MLFGRMGSFVACICVYWQIFCRFELLAASFSAAARQPRPASGQSGSCAGSNSDPLPLDLPLRPLGRGGPCSAQGRRLGRNLAPALRRGGPAGTSLVAALQWPREACIGGGGRRDPGSCWCCIPFRHVSTVDNESQLGPRFPETFWATFASSFFLLLLFHNPPIVAFCLSSFLLSLFFYPL